MEMDRAEKNKRENNGYGRQRRSKIYIIGILEEGNENNGTEKNIQKYNLRKLFRNKRTESIE